MKTRDESLQLESAGTAALNPATFCAVRHDLHPMGRWCDLVAPNAVRPFRSTIKVPGPMPKYGEHTLAILQELGFSNKEVREMLESGAAGLQWSDKFLPE